MDSPPALAGGGNGNGPWRRHTRATSSPHLSAERMGRWVQGEPAFNGDDGPPAGSRGGLASFDQAARQFITVVLRPLAKPGLGNRRRNLPGVTDPMRHLLEEGHQLRYKSLV